MKFVHRLFPSTSPQPDRPQPFGYKQAWFTLSSTDTAAVAQAFNLTVVQPCTWNDGICFTSRDLLFVSPPIQSWIFVVGNPAALLDEQTLGLTVPPLLNRLSARFGTADYFATHRVVDYHVWARSEAGRLVRGYAYLGQRDETLWDEGAPTTETELGLAFFDERSREAQEPADWEHAALQSPSEETVMQMARHWCLAPVDLTPDDSPPALGLRGVIAS